jgi:uncharacterized membrane protein YheB (UPF0754 family)
MAKILGNEIVTTEELNQFKVHVIIPIINKNKKQEKIIANMTWVLGGTIGVLLTTIVVLIAHAL